VEDFTTEAALQCIGRTHVTEVLHRLNANFAACLASAAEDSEQGHSLSSISAFSGFAELPTVNSQQGPSTTPSDPDVASSGAGWHANADTAVNLEQGDEDRERGAHDSVIDDTARQRMADAQEIAREFGGDMPVISSAQAGEAPPDAGVTYGLSGLSLADVGDSLGHGSRDHAMRRDGSDDAFDGESDAGDSMGVLDDGEGEAMDAAAMMGGFGGSGPGPGPGTAVGERTGGMDDAGERSGGTGEGFLRDEDAIELLPG